ncbi:MAG: DUF4375 domain-containing protein [Flavipsychrobacter sp.]|nr:DUF4375 domain-containing protein [Flavipsychrobacter sp.]
MSSSFLPPVTQDELEEKLSAGDEALLEFLAEPIHAELYARQDFTFVDQLSEGQQLLISYDYVRMQVLQGGFIQFIQNGYIGILPPMPEWLNKAGATATAQTIDDALKVYVLNRELLDKPTTTEEFAKLYDELKEFELLDEQFSRQNDETVKAIAHYARTHISDFVKVA